jgi:hypothetical protein
LVDASEKKQLRNAQDELTAHQPESFEKWPMTPTWDISHDSPSELYPYSVQVSEVGGETRHDNPQLWHQGISKASHAEV